MWSGANNEMAYTVQILKYIHMGEGKGYKIHVSDGKTFTLLLINSKPEIAEMIVEKGEGLINSIGLIEVKSSPHPKNAGQKLLFLQTLKILQEGVEKIGEPVKFESENQAKKDTDTPKQVYSCFSLPLDGYLACLSSAELATILILIRPRGNKVHAEMMQSNRSGELPFALSLFLSRLIRSLARALCPCAMHLC
jgi:hypothetical protein